MARWRIGFALASLVSGLALVGCVADVESSGEADDEETQILDDAPKKTIAEFPDPPPDED